MRHIDDFKNDSKRDFPRNRTIPNIVGFKDLENVIKNNSELKNKAYDFNDKDPRLK